jgi:hypothetical protein
MLAVVEAGGLGSVSAVASTVVVGGCLATVGRRFGPRGVAGFSRRSVVAFARVGVPVNGWRSGFGLGGDCAIGGVAGGIAVRVRLASGVNLTVAPDRATTTTIGASTFVHAAGI